MPIAAIALLTLMTQSKQTSEYTEKLRPQFHFTAKTGWLNDPNGLVFYGGTYHLFFQHNPYSTEWGNMTWGHATSPDLVHWHQQANAIEPDKLGTIFSGSAVVDWKNTAGFQDGKDPALVCIYCCAGGTSPESKGQPFTQCLSYSADAGKTWTKYSGNPVVPHVAGENRDPKVFWYEPQQKWVMALFLDGNDFALFGSNDLKKWGQMQRFKFDGVGECPDFFEIPVQGSDEKKWVFTSASGRYLVGSFDGLHFKPEQKALSMDDGPNYYAVQTYSDIPSHDGRRIQIAWMNGGKYPEMPFNQQMSFPCVLSLHRKGDIYKIHRNPVNEIHKLYGQTYRERGLAMKAGENVLSKLKGDLWDIEFEIEPKDASQIVLDIHGNHVTLDPSTGTVKSGDRTVHLSPERSRFELRALVDRTSFELFGNEGALSFTSCYLPSKGAPLSLSVVGGAAHLTSLTAHALKSAW